MSDWNDPYPYQERVTEYLLAGQSVILQAPTGSGKTAASLLPYLHARKNLEADKFPRKCIYSVPMKVLANQFNAEYRKIITRYGWQNNLQVGIQTGDRPNDPKLEQDLIFTTIDQTLSNFLNIPYSLGGSSANLNAGAILSSYLVFDELHLFDPDITLPTTLQMLQMLKGITPFIVMTATFSSTMLHRLADRLGAVVVPEDDAARTAMLKIGSQVGKERRFFTIDEELTAGQVLAHSGRRTICICNTVASAQRLYRELKSSLAEKGDAETKICLLHSRFYKSDRDDKENWIREQFGVAQEDYNGPSLIVVATQVIEVGVDATCDVMHTEVAPAASVLQRAGRCARRAGEKGKVYIYLPRDDEGEPYFAPYFLKSQARKTERGRRLCEETWAALNESRFNGCHMDFVQEQALIDIVHTPIDEAILQGIKGARHNRRGRMLETMREQDRGLARELIRNVNSRFLFIHPDPQHDERLARYPWAYDGFSLHPSTLAQGYKQAEEMVDPETPWIMRTARSVTNEEDAQANQPPQYSWKQQVWESGEVFDMAVLAVHPTVVRYDTELGLRFEPSTDTSQSPLRERKTQRERYSYELETYAEHVAGLYNAYCNPVGKYLPLRDEIAFIAQVIEENERFRLSSGAVERMLRALFVCHDLGKLNVAWQQWAHQWQREVGRFYGNQDMSIPADYMAAHTKFEPTDDQKEAQRKIGKRPNHAGESAMAAMHLLFSVGERNEPLWKAAMTAVFRHHSASTSSYEPFVAHEAAHTALAEALSAVDLPPELGNQVTWQIPVSTSLSRVLVDFSKRNLEEALLYFLLVRVLRLADQRSQV